jgi:hypothetical protein
MVISIPSKAPKALVPGVGADEVAMEAQIHAYEEWE